MRKRAPVNIAASIHQRLLNKAKQEGRPFNELLQYYAMERFLFRLSRTRHGKKFVLKGALMLAVWNAPVSRPTKDIDLLGKLKNDAATVGAAMRGACQHEVKPDGLVFDSHSIKTVAITEDSDYEGVRVKIRGHLGNVRVSLQIDIGFGDVIAPPPKMLSYPTMLDHLAPRIACYSRESAIAEKFHAMVKRGTLNSRMKDFYDIWLLSRQFNFSGRALATAIRKTFANSATDIPGDPIAFKKAFWKDAAKLTQWKAFARKSRLDHAPASFAAVAAPVTAFLKPIAKALAAGESFTKAWRAPGPWM